MARTTTMRERYIIEWDDDSEGWLLMLPDGSITRHGTPLEAFRAVNRHARKRHVPIHIGVIEWRNVPEGFVPPEA